MVPLSLLLVFLVAAEVRDIVSYVCSNWTKVVLTCCLFPNTEQSLSMRKWFVQVLRCRCKLIEHQWDDRIGQCSVLPLHPRTNPLALFRHHLQLPDYKIKANAAMKVSIINALRSSKNDGGHLILSNGKASLYRSGEQGGERFIWACNSISVSNNILSWQIATSILEVRYPLQPQQQGYVLHLLLQKVIGLLPLICHGTARTWCSAAPSCSLMMMHGARACMRLSRRMRSMLSLNRAASSVAITCLGRYRRWAQGRCEAWEEAGGDN